MGGTYSTGTTYTITIGGTDDSEAVAISVLGSGGSNTTVATALTAACAASTHPYFKAITWTSSSAVITATAVTVGVPFVAVASYSGSTGTLGAYTAVTASAGPTDWSTALNWSTGSVPATGDSVFIKNFSGNICFGLAQSAVTLANLVISKTFTGLLGLDTQTFTTDVNAETASTTTEVEYRQAYLQISVSGLMNIGENASLIGNATGSARIMIDIGSTANQIVQISGSATSAEETGLPAIRMLANAVSALFYVRSAPGGFGLAMDHAGETATVGSVYVSDPSTATKTILGNGVTIHTLYEQIGGTNLVQSAATVPTINVKGGVLTTEGSWVCTAMNIFNGASVTANNYGSPMITTLNLYGGTLTLTSSSQARTITTTNYIAAGDGAILADASYITFTTIAPPAAKFTLTAS